MSLGCQSQVVLYGAKDGCQRAVRCGHCLNCSIRRQLALTMRMQQEGTAHASSSFVTLTYKDENRPHALTYDHVQGFMKRLRFWNPEPVRFFSVGQYGTRTQREHWHAILYGVDPGALALKCNARSGITRFGAAQYLAERPTELWPHGGMHICDTGIAQMRYVARYSLKESADGLQYRVEMSRKPGIGLEQIRQIGAYCATQQPHLKRVPGWWKIGKHWFPLDRSGYKAWRQGYEGAGGKIDPECALKSHWEARLVIVGGDAAVPFSHGSWQKVRMREMERGAL